METLISFGFMLKKVVYPDDYMDSWEKLNDRKCIGKKYKSIRKYRKTIYAQSDTLFQAYTFENFRSKCIETCEIDPAHFLLAPGLAWQACSEKSDIVSNGRKINQKQKISCN